MVWYTGQFYALFFLEQTLKVDGATANMLIAVALLLGTPFFVVFGWLSDRIGRKPIILAGCLLAALTYFPLFKALTQLRQSGAGRGQRRRAGRRWSPIPADCSFQFDPVGKNKFTSVLRHRQERAGQRRRHLYERRRRRPGTRRRGQDRHGTVIAVLRRHGAADGATARRSKAASTKTLAARAEGRRLSGQGRPGADQQADGGRCCCSCWCST